MNLELGWLVHCVAVIDALVGWQITLEVPVILIAVDQ